MCGIGAVYNPESLLKDLYTISIGLQHRGHESAGAGIFFDSGTLYLFRDYGHANEVYDRLEADILRHGHSGAAGKAGIIHDRYSTTGDSVANNAQPLRKGNVLLAHNGNLVNTEQLRQSPHQHTLSTTTDSELIACLFADSSSIYDGAQRCVEQCLGTYNLVVMNNRGELGVFRDPTGNHPLFAGYKGGSFYAASEDFALVPLDLDSVEEMKPGELIVVSEKSIDRKILGENISKHQCPFEAFYFMKHGSTFRGRYVDDIRREAGRQLAKRYPVDADFIIPILDSGTSYAYGLSEESGIPIIEALVKNSYVGRTYTSPEGKTGAQKALQLTRQEMSKLKHVPMREKIRGKRVIYVDDSNVRGNVGRITTTILRNAGAREVHGRYAFPPVRYPCFYGMDHAVRRKLIAAPFGRDINERMAELMGADSIGYLFLDDLKENLGSNDMCFACVNGQYFTEIPDTQHFRSALELS